MADINDYLEGLNYNLSAEEKQLMDIYAECWEHCRKGDCHNCEYRSGNKWCKMLLCMSYQYAKRLIAAGYSKRLFPAADVAQVVHGRWIDAGERYDDYDECFYSVFKCSNCGTTKEAYPTSNYCPNCGAKMDEEVKL